MDMLIIKNENNVEIENKIGKIFRRYNIVEYKSPDDALGVDAFYKVLELYGEAILKVVTNANATKIEKWKEDKTMTCEALERIMAPELKASMRRGKIEGKILAYTDVGMSVEAIAEKVSLSVQEVKKILADSVKQ